MPLLRSRSAPVVPADLDDWRPQLFGRNARSVKDAIIEPSWGGVRVLARIDAGKTLFFDEEGIDCTEEFEDLADELGPAARGDGLILDGFLTIQPTQSAIGTSPAETEVPGAGQVLSTMIVGSRGRPRPSSRRPMDTDKPIAFVAVDLLRIDGTLLVDLPLLERKRILDGALAPGERVRVTPFIRPPLGSYGATWRGMGFREVAYKGANSRYYPAARNEDWAIAAIPAR